MLFKSRPAAPYLSTAIVPHCRARRKDEIWLFLRYGRTGKRACDGLHCRFPFGPKLICLRFASICAGRQTGPRRYTKRCRCLHTVQRHLFVSLSHFALASGLFALSAPIAPYAVLSPVEIPHAPCNRHDHRARHHRDGDGQQICTQHGRSAAPRLLLNPAFPPNLRFPCRRSSPLVQKGQKPPTDFLLNPFQRFLSTVHALLLCLAV